MDPAAVKRWTAVLKQLSEDPKWIAGNAGFGGIPSVMSAADTEKFVSDSYATYQALVQKTGMEIK
jgi:tripartite-type tricarboxylate transporter receptor subunit TctC